MLTVLRTTDKQEELNLKMVREQLKLKSVSQSLMISPENRKVRKICENVKAVTSHEAT